MGIGGYDLIIDHNKSSDEVFLLVMKTVKKFWPTYITEADDDPADCLIFIYPNKTSLDNWTNRKNRKEDDMIAFYNQPNRLTLVHEDETGLIDEIKKHFSGT